MNNPADTKENPTNFTPEQRVLRSQLKSVNRWCKRNRVFQGGRCYGVDWPTWYCSHPQIAAFFRATATELLGKEGFYMPIALTQS
jgi:hypothetical protein